VEDYNSPKNPRNRVDPLSSAASFGSHKGASPRADHKIKTGQKIRSKQTVGGGGPTFASGIQQSKGGSSRGGAGEL